MNTAEKIKELEDHGWYKDRGSGWRHPAKLHNSQPCALEKAWQLHKNISKYAEWERNQ